MCGIISLWKTTCSLLTVDLSFISHSRASVCLKVLSETEGIMERCRTLPSFKIYGVNEKILSIGTGGAGISESQCITRENKMCSFCF